MQPEIFVPFIFFAFLTSIVVVPILAKERTKRSAHELVARALDRGQQLDPALVAQLSESIAQEGNRARKSLGNAVVLLALAGACAGIAFVSGDSDIHSGSLVPAVLFGALGAAFLVLSIIDYSSKKREA